MSDACQSVKGYCNLFIEPQLTSFLVFYNLSHVFKICTIIQYGDISYQENSGSIAKSLHANTRNTTPVQITGFAIL